MAWYRPWDKQGNVARSRRGQEIADRQAAEAATQDPYGPNAPAWDAAGFPEGPMPKGKFALDYQYEANRRAEQRRQVLWGDAQGSMQQGMDLFQSYRPGGAAAAASGMYGQKAGLSATQALNTAAPDLLIDWREQIRARAEEKADELNRNAQLITGLSAFNFWAGGTSAALQTPPPAEDPNANRSTPAGGTYNAGNSTVPPVGQGAGFGGPGGPEGPTSPTPTAGGGGGVLPGILPPEERRMIGGGSAADVFDAGGYGGGPAGPGQAGPGGGGRPGPGGGRGGMTDEGGAGMGGAQIAGGGGLGDFSGPAVANRGMAGAPMSADVALEVWAEDPQREQSTALMVASARDTLLSAIALG